MTTTWTVGDTAPALAGIATTTPYNSTVASPVDLTTAASGTVLVGRSDGSTFTRAATLGGVAGTFSAPLQAGDLTVDGDYKMSLRVVWADTSIETFGRLWFHVDPKIA